VLSVTDAIAKLQDTMVALDKAKANQAAGTGGTGQAGDWQELPELPVVVGASLVPVIPESTAAAALESQTRALLREVAGLQKQLEQLQNKLDDKDETILELTRRLAGAETELRLYREGRIKPDSPA
ncbi:MAG: hypothetical protein IAE80_00555, partial [Anaerolinea sp.]|nr:hypothetical protein [Anaerolinea sp.]